MISEIYSQIVIDDLIKSRFLDHGRSPNADQTAAIVGQVAGRALGIKGSAIVFVPTPDTESSARAFQEAIRTLSQEVHTVTSSSSLIKARGARLFDRIENQTTLIAKRAADIALESCSLQQGRRQGYNLFNWDNFQTLDLVDQQKCSVDLDPRARGARLRARPNIRRIDLTSLTDVDFDARVVTGDFSLQTMAPGSSFKFMVDDSDSYWMHRVFAIAPGPKTLQLTIDMREIHVINHVEFEPFGSNNEVGLDVRVLTSENLINWREIMASAPQAVERVIAIGEATKARYLRIEMARQTPSYRTSDAAGFVYEFGINALRVYESEYYKAGQFISKPIEFKDINNISQIIHRLRFEIYDEQPDGTDITYYISTDTDPVVGLIRITPGEEIQLPTVLLKQQDQGKVRSRFDSHHALIDLKLEDDYLPETVRFFRNTFQQGVLIDGVQAGWGFKDSYYSCIFEIANRLTLNLGVNFAFLDGKKVNGIQVLQPGEHTFKTHETNWRPAATEAADPLFPYNHKLLIEGLQDSKAYLGVDFLASAKMSLISPFDLIENIPSDSQEYFAIRSGFPMVKIPRPPVFLTEVEGWRKEQFAIRYKFISSELTPITSIRLVARMASTSSRLTPVFKGYLALAGY